MTFNAADYHPDWKSISRQIRDQAGDRCEWCGVANGAVGARDRFGDWHDEHMVHGMNHDVGYDLFSGQFPDMVRIVLTVAHLSQDKTDNDPCNLRALCQRCHLNHDRPHHLAVQAENRRRRRIERGQYELELAVPV